MGYRPDETILHYISFVVPKGFRVLKGREAHGSLRDTGQPPAKIHYCCSNSTFPKGAQPI